MPQLIYNAAARRELVAIATFISHASGDPAAGRDFAERLTRHCESLARLPCEMGRPRPDLGRRLRSSVCEGYLVIFRFEDRSGPRSHMIVVHILNGGRDLARVSLRPRSLH